MTDIALIHYAAPPIVGGVESVLGHHVRLMTSRDHRVRIVAGRGGDIDARAVFVPAPQADSRHPDVLAVKAQLDRGVVPPEFERLTEELQRELASALVGADIVIAHNVCSLHKNLALTAALRRHCAAANAPRLIVWHHDLAWTRPRYRSELHDGWPWSLIREDWPEARRQHVAVSELRRRELSELIGVSPAAIAVVPSGLDAAAFLGLAPRTQEIVARLGLLDAGPVLLLPVRITRRKNIQLALHVLAQLVRDMPAARLIVTGPPGPHNPSNQTYFRELLALRAELGLERAVSFLAELEEEYLPDEVIADLYRVADALLLPSREEGFGIPLLEAGLIGLPIFCADIPPLREIADGAADYFSLQDDPQVIAARIADVLDARGTYRLRSRIRREYTWEGVYKRCIAPLLEMHP